MSGTSKKCGSCGSEDLRAKVTIQKIVPLADRNWTIKIGGQKIGQADLKASWDKLGGQENGPDQTIRGPIICADCETEHFVVMGDPKPLRVGSVEEARLLGYDELKTR